MTTLSTTTREIIEERLAEERRRLEFAQSDEQFHWEQSAKAWDRGAKIRRTIAELEADLAKVDA